MTSAVINTENVPPGGWTVNGDHVMIPRSPGFVTHVQWISYVKDVTGLPA